MNANEMQRLREQYLAGAPEKLELGPAVLRALECCGFLNDYEVARVTGEKLGSVGPVLTFYRQAGLVTRTSMKRNGHALYGRRFT